MSSRHAIVLGGDPDSILKKHFESLKSYKKADWLYEGCHYREDLTAQAMIEVIFAKDEVAPNYVIDHNSLFSREQFSQETWRQTVLKLLDMTRGKEEVSFYIIEA